MYAECPHCRAIFRVTPEILQQAEGKVRCGECKNIFAAVTGTAEDSKHQHTLAPPPSQEASPNTHENQAPPVTPTDAPSHGGRFIDPALTSLDSGLTDVEIPDVYAADLSANLPVAYTGPPIKPRRRLSLNFSPTVIALCLLLLFFTQYLR